MNLVSTQQAVSSTCLHDPSLHRRLVAAKIEADCSKAGGVRMLRRTRAREKGVAPWAALSRFDGSIEHASADRICSIAHEKDGDGCVVSY